MTLTLRICGIDRLDNGAAAELVLDRRGAVIGRAASCDWSLPDPRNFISSRHLEVSYDDGGYLVTDVSTNGTFLNGAAERMTGPHRVQAGDTFQVGAYQIAAELAAEGSAPVRQASVWEGTSGDGSDELRAGGVWGSIESSNAVDWARADFGESRPAHDRSYGGTLTAESEPPRTAAHAASAEPNEGPTTDALPSADIGTALATLAAAAGLRPEQLKEPGPGTLERAGRALRRLVSGLVVMVEARARAKSQMGAEQTGLEFDGNNPIKFARSPDQALLQMLNPTERGFMPTERAIEDAFFDLQSHQIATLQAMQGALRATLDRFSPAAIRNRAESGGLLARLVPGGREATLWATYEKEFSGIAQGSDEAFMTVFATEFRKAYDEQSRARRPG